MGIKELLRGIVTQQELLNYYIVKIIVKIVEK